MNTVSDKGVTRKKQKLRLGRSYEFYIIAFFSAFIVGLLFLYFRTLSPFIYQTNDDLFLKMLVSGETCGTSQPRLYYISYPTGLFLSGLYKLFPQVPWYGLFFCFVIGLTMTIILHNLLWLEKSLPVRILTVLLFGFFSYGFLFLHIAELQYTTVTAMAGCGALFLFALIPHTDSYHEIIKKSTGFLLLSACTFCIRKDVFFMFLPFIGMIGLGKYLDAGKQPDNEKHQIDTKLHYEGKRPLPSIFHLNKQRKCLITLAGIFIAITVFLCLIEKLAYQREDWHAFSDYTEASTTIYDYLHYPDYDTYKETYQALGISRSSYEAAAQHYSITLEPNINKKTMETLEKIAKQERRLSYANVFDKLREMTGTFMERHLSYVDRPLNLLVYCCYILFFLCSILCRKSVAIRDILFLGFARMVIWTYLVFYGRLPSRVSQSIYLAELVILLAIAFRNRIWELPEAFNNTDSGKVNQNSTFRKRLCAAFWSISIIFITLVCIRFGFPKAKAAAWEASSRLQFSQSFVDISNYFHAHPDNFYYLDMNSFSSFTEDALQKPACKYDNFLYLGSWMPHSPWYDEKFERAGIINPAAALFENPNVFVVFMNIDDTSYGYLQNFYAENYPGVSLEVVETVDVSNGLQFLILKVLHNGDSFCHAIQHKTWENIFCTG